MCFPHVCSELAMSRKFINVCVEVKFLCKNSCSVTNIPSFCYCYKIMSTMSKI